MIRPDALRWNQGMLRPDGRSNHLVPLVVGVVLVGMAALSGALSLAGPVRVSGPAVGDIVAFDANLGVPEDLPGRLSVVRADGTPCQLDLQVMQRVHGSLIVDAATSGVATGGSPPSFRLHWTGAHSSLDAGDCGATAEIVASDRVMAALLVATGGVGVGPGKRALPVYLLGHTPKGGQ
jgi:hypothetical protein